MFFKNDKKIFSPEAILLFSSFILFFFLNSYVETELLLSTVPLTKLELKFKKAEEKYLKLKEKVEGKSSKITVTLYQRHPENKFIKLIIKGLNMDKISNGYRSNLKKMFNALTTSDYYKEFDKKVVFIQGIGENSKTKYPLHQSILLTNETSFNSYYSKVKKFINDNWKGDAGYSQLVSDEFLVTINDAEKLKNLNVKQIGVKEFIITKRLYSTMLENRNLIPIIDPAPVFTKDIVRDPKKESRFIISPVSKDTDIDKPFCAMDIETIILDPNTNEHIPIAISTYSEDFNKLFLIDSKLLKKDSKKAVQNLFKEYLNFMIKLRKNYTIFIHNLGNYDGYFLYQNLMMIVKHPKELSPLIDNSNQFISIQYNFFYYLNEEEASSIGMSENEARKPNMKKLIWKDSMRIFPGSLNSLCKQFGVEGKISSYKPEFNNIDLFDKPELLKIFKEYSIQDSVALYQAMKNARELYFKNYKIDICTIFSTASLAFKIFRSHFLSTNIPLLTNFQDEYIREAYLGGATDYYKSIGEKIYWYDVNSLYPYAMLEPVPYKLVKKHTDLSGVEVKNFKGFVKARVTCPDNIVNPIVALKFEGKTIYPRGEWIGTYFADYLAKAETFGYKIELISGLEFEYKNLFKEYIGHFYEIKKTSKGSLRYLAKLKLNSLYGMFGRKMANNITLNIKTDKVPDYMNIFIVKNMIDFGNGYTTLITEASPNPILMDELNLILKTKFKVLEDPTYANVAIAAAITARAQMIMMDYKNNPDFEVYYTDTDSIFTNNPLPPFMVGNLLGQMKNETLDKFGVETIDKACFVGLKKYGLQITDKDGIKHELSTFAGVPKDSLSFDEVLNIHNGEILHRNLKDRFNKSISNFSIKTQTNVTLRISNARDKQLINNNYIPININLNLIYNDSDAQTQKIIKKILKLRKKQQQILTPLPCKMNHKLYF